MKKIANMLGALSTALSDEMRGVIDDTLGVAGETAAAIITLGANPGLAVGRLAAALGLTHSGTVRLADRLEREGLLDRSPGEDSRSVLLTLTRDGDRVRRTALRQRERVLDRALSYLSPDEVSIIGVCLDKMLRGLLTKQSSSYRFCRLCDEECCVPEHCPVEERSEELFG